MRILLFVITILLQSQVVALTAIKISNGEWEPFMSKQLANYGPISRIVTAAFAEEGITVEWQFYPWKRGLELARKGQIDGTAVWTKSSDRQISFRFSDLVFSSETKIYYNTAAPLEWQHLNDLQGLIVGTTRGYFYGDEFAKAQENKVFTVTEANTDLDNFKLLAHKKIHAFPCNTTIAKTILNSASFGAQNNIQSHPKTLRQDNLYLMVSRKSPNSEEIITKFNAGLKKLQAKDLVAVYLGSEKG